ncbi:MAG TPA: restriction endonuclease subunit S [Candidatus Protoclostridium stercorigallinarum]|mgnify:CR=1 FL=1|uniref:Restriction endonuclease subunit S n=1 Tax=Candidatus Protoclostridium stercorigallinarum TaxID=2838741 RepID=A0A9D1Q1T6_9FIRM|nr:restriction endonuclease subunit S [Candidatus Protoclostridium stercorigallinarum]
MKNSGIEWIGEIPDDWNLIRFKDICVNRKEIAGTQSSNFDRLALTLNGVIRRDKDDSDGLQPKEFDCYQIIHENDFIFKMIDLQNISTSRVGLSPYMGLVSPAYIRFSPRKEGQYNLFVYYFLMSLYYNCVYNNLGGNGVRSALNATDMGQFLIPFPSIDTQIHIVSMIENRCVAVDKLIENQQAQIEKLKEYKQSVITEAVTKGLDPSVPMKPSGVEWIGEVPINFSIQNIRSLFQIRKEVIGREPETVLSITQSGLKIKNVSENEGQMANSYANYQIVHIGDFAMNHMDLLTGGIGISKYEGVTSPDYRVFKIKKVSYIKKYFLYVFETYYRNKIFYAFGQGAANLGRWRLPAQNFYSIFIPVPSVKDQQQIADHLDKKCAEIDKLISVKQQKIEKLNEYKKSLIYEYVTGKKEVG